MNPVTLLKERGIQPGKILLLTEVGSTAHGIHSESEDTDYTAVFLQTFDELLNGVNESRMVRTAAEGERSGPDDIDINVYSLRKFARLIKGGNPSLLVALFSRKPVITNPDVDWEELETLIRSKRVGYAFLGYMNQQLDRWRGKSSKRVSRPELVEAHGYDTKYASHVLRLGWQGLEYMEHGRFSVPMAPERALFLTNVRRGDYEERHLLNIADEIMRQLEKAIEQSDFPEKGRSIDKWLLKHYAYFYEKGDQLL